MDTTTIEIREDQWSDLNGMKGPGDAMKDVVDELLEVRAEVDERGIELEALGADDVDAEAIADEHQTFDEVADSVAENAETGGTIGEILEGWFPGRSRDERGPRRAAGRAALETLRDGGQMTRGDFEDALLPEYDVEGQNRDTWWKNSVRPALTRAREADVVEHIHGPPHRYEWIGE